MQELSVDHGQAGSLRRTPRVLLDRVSTRRNGSRPRFEIFVEKKYGLGSNQGERWCLQRKRCRECGKKIEGRRTKWCSQGCVDAYLIRSSPSMARRFVRARDQGICANCGLDTFRVRAEVKAATLAVSAAWRESYRLKCPRVPVSHVRWSHRRWCPAALLDQGRLARQKVLKVYGMAQHWRRKSFWDQNHVVAVEDGGGECDIGNLQSLCLRCHADRSAYQRTRKANRKKGRATLRRRIGQ